MAANENIERARDAMKTAIEAEIRKRDAANQAIAKLYPLYDYLNLLCERPSDAILNVVEPEADKGLGLSDAIRHVLKKAAPALMTPTGIRDGLVEIGFDLKKYANVMPPIHNTLKRLEESGEIESSKTAYGKGYRWRGEIGRALKDLEMTPLPVEVERDKRD